jgi:hypothetical protein
MQFVQHCDLHDLQSQSLCNVDIGEIGGGLV